MPLLGSFGVSSFGLGKPVVVEAAVTAFDLLQTEILTSEAANVTFSNLNASYGSDYQHLQLRINARGNRNAGNSPLYLQFNSSGGTAYSSHNLLSAGTGLFSENFTSKALIERAGNVAGSQAGAGVFGANIIDILDPFNTSKDTTIRGLGGGSYANGPIAGLWSGWWSSTSAIDSIQLTDYSATNFQIGSRFSLYGLKGV